MPLQPWQRTAREVAKGLTYLHRSGVIHGGAGPRVCTRVCAHIVCVVLCVPVFCVPHVGRIHRGAGPPCVQLAARVLCFPNCVHVCVGTVCLCATCLPTHLSYLPPVYMLPVCPPVCVGLIVCLQLPHACLPTCLFAGQYIYRMYLCAGIYVSM